MKTSMKLIVIVNNLIFICYLDIVIWDLLSLSEYKFGIFILKSVNLHP